MNLSEAIRLGAMLRPQGYCGFYIPTFDATCALGAALESHGQLNKQEPLSPAQNVYLQQSWPFLNATADVCCPVCAIESSAFNVIVHLNDFHKVTREQIADWVQTIEPPAPAQERDQPEADDAVATPMDHPQAVTSR